jgi:hypothetical protein
MVYVTMEPPDSRLVLGQAATATVTTGGGGGDGSSGGGDGLGGGGDCGGGAVLMHVDAHANGSKLSVGTVGVAVKAEAR